MQQLHAQVLGDSEIFAAAVLRMYATVGAIAYGVSHHAYMHVRALTLQVLPGARPRLYAGVFHG